MRFLTALGCIVLLLGVGFRLLFASFQAFVVAPSSLSLEIMGFTAGLLCLVAGMVCCVLWLRSKYHT